MNMVRLVTVAATGAVLCVHCCTLGLCWNCEAVMGDAFWWRHLVATLGALERREGAAREKVRIAARGTAVEAMSYRVGMVEIGGVVMLSQWQCS